MKNLIVTFPNWGNYTVVFKILFRSLNIEVIPPEKTHPRTILEGAKLSPEMFCFPFKVNMGNYLSAIEKGANTILMTTASGGSCRLRYYGITQEKILKEMGKEVNFVLFDQGLKDVIFKLKKLSGKSFFEILTKIKFLLKMILFVEKLEKKANFLRPREIEKGKTDTLFEDAMKILEGVKDEKDFEKKKKEIFEEFNKIKFEKDADVPKVGLIGEIYTVCDPKINFEVERKLGKEGIEVHREINLSYHLTKKFLLKDWRMQRKIKKYLTSTVGGHGRDAVFEMIKFAEKGFDGVIQLLPAMCMPETTVRPILEKIHQETGIPFLSFSFDEEVAEAGFDTRLEAFADVVKAYHKKRTSIQTS